MKVLFSPIGMTDPIATYRDGAMLHIIRTYRPDKVVLYMSKEVCECEENDNRYSYCLDHLKELLDIDFEVECIRRRELVDVQLFDYFFKEFKDILDDLHNDEDEIILNVSSGTPAMKSALQNLSVMLDYPLIPIQVSTPNKSMNERKENVKKDYAVEAQWECNEDNAENYVNRCTDSDFYSMFLEMKKKKVFHYLDAYDYVAALEVLESISKSVNRNAVLLTKAGIARLKLDKKTCEKLSNEAGYDMYPIKQDDKRKCFEYFMLLKIKCYKEEYADFLRAISPLSFTLMERIINNTKRLKINDYKVLNSKTNQIDNKWDEKKVASNSDLKKVAARMNKELEGFIFNWHYVYIVDELSNSDNTKKMTKKIRNIEENLRNLVAHSITEMTDKKIIQATGGTDANGIIKLLEQYCRCAGIDITDKAMHTYDSLNEEIKKYLNLKID